MQDLDDFDDPPQIFARPDDRPRCRTCIHFDGADPRAAVDHDSCRRIVHSSEMRKYDPAYVGDHEDYWATLFVSPDFGCVLHEAKEEA